MQQAQGSKRILGVALLLSAVVMGVLAVLFWTGVMYVTAEARPLVAGALVAAAVIDFGVGIAFLRAAVSE